MSAETTKNTLGTEINENNLPAELFPGYTTVEYQMDNKNPRPPCFMLVLDTATTAEELQDAKDSLGQLVALLPEECLVGLITFGATVTVHELCDGPMPKSYVLRGTDDITQDQLKKLTLRVRQENEAREKAEQLLAEMKFADIHLFHCIHCVCHQHHRCLAS